MDKNTTFLDEYIELNNYISNKKKEGNGVTGAEETLLYHDLTTAATCSIADSLHNIAFFLGEIVKNDKAKAAYNQGLISVTQLNNIMYGETKTEDEK